MLSKTKYLGLPNYFYKKFVINILVFSKNNNS